jgi:hypothetical protein
MFLPLQALNLIWYRTREEVRRGMGISWSSMIMSSQL